MGWVINATLQPLYPREGPGIHLIGGCVGPQGRSRRVQKISPLPGLDPRTVQPVASRLTAYPGPPFCPEINMNSGYGLLQFISSPFDAGSLPSMFDVSVTTKLSKFGEIRMFILFSEQHNCLDLVF